MKLKFLKCPHREGIIIISLCDILHNIEFISHIIQINLEEIDEQDLTIAKYCCLLGWNTVLKALLSEFRLNLDDIQAALSDYSVLGGFEDNIAFLLQYRNSMKYKIESVNIIYTYIKLSEFRFIYFKNVKDAFDLH
jgi:hypothetical protein